MCNWVVNSCLKTLNSSYMMYRNGHKHMSAKYMIIELVLIFQNHKLANEINVIAIGTRFGHRWLNGLSPIFWMFKYFLNIYWDLVLKVQESYVKNKSYWNKLNCKNQIFGTIGSYSSSTRPVWFLTWVPHAPCGPAGQKNRKSSFLSFACPIQLIPVSMVLVKIINGKFGIIEIFGNTQGYFGHF